MLNFSHPFSHIVAKFVLEGKKYDIEQFRIGFVQPSDYKGQPQHEVKGGQIHITMSEAASDDLYNWAKRSTLLKSGSVLFQTDMGITVLEIIFTNAYCVSLTREVSSFAGTCTMLTIAPENVKLDGVEHDNFW
jgi:hypothetical protein